MSGKKATLIAGDGITDDSAALQRMLDEGTGFLHLPGRAYRITRPLRIRLEACGPVAIQGGGGATKLIMDGPGPALDFVGTHRKPAGPTSVTEAIWEKERMPTVSQLEIEGRHPEAVGIRMDGVMQPTFYGLLIRNVHTGIHLTGWGRNALIDHCHILGAEHAGIHLDHINLHQINVTGNHLSFCRYGAIRVEHSEIRNLQITGNDIEYNTRMDQKDSAADIWIDTRHGRVREGTIVSNTIQAYHTASGASIRMIGKGPGEHHSVGLFSITGNLIGAQKHNIHLTAAHRVAITGNCLYGTLGHSVRVEHSQFINFAANTFGCCPEYSTPGCSLRFEDSTDCVLSGTILQDCWKDRRMDNRPQDRLGLIELVRCRRMNLHANQVLDPSPDGIVIEDCSDTILTGCTVMETRPPTGMGAAVRWTGAGSGNLIAHCRLGAGTEGTVIAPPHVRREANV